MYTFSFRALRKQDHRFAELRPIPVSHPRKKRTPGRLRHYDASLESRQNILADDYMTTLLRLYEKA